MLDGPFPVLPDWGKTSRDRVHWDGYSGPFPVFYETKTNPTGDRGPLRGPRLDDRPGGPPRNGSTETKPRSDLRPVYTEKVLKGLRTVK